MTIGMHMAIVAAFKILYVQLLFFTTASTV